VSHAQRDMAKWKVHLAHSVALNSAPTVGQYAYPYSVQWPVVSKCTFQGMLPVYKYWFGGGLLENNVGAEFECVW
jgi:hypothetical protein